jgi:hypothetical protein
LVVITTTSFAVGIVHEGVARWMLKKKKGNSNSDERRRFIEEMLKIFPSCRDSLLVWRP